MRRPSDGECLDVKGSFLKPGGVVGDENERAEMDLAALNHLAAGNHDDDRKTNLQLHQQVAKTPAPQLAPPVTSHAYNPVDRLWAPRRRAVTSSEKGLNS